MHYFYIKKLPGNPSPFFNFFLSKLFPLSLVFFGLFILGTALFPIISYQIFTAPRFMPMVKPIADDEYTQAVLGERADQDLTRPANWFLKAPRFPARPTKITHYTLSIPKLKIKDALVTIGGEDLNDSLIQYEGTAFPGQFGNTVIFGHSVLPAFFNPENYLTIFSTLPTLEKGDEIGVDFDGVLYKYVVDKMVEVEPTDISVLEQHFDDFYLTLVTCVPPGTYLRRLAVRARLDKS